MFNRKLKNENAKLVEDNARLNAILAEVTVYNAELADKLEDMMKMYPLAVGQTVYDVQLRSSKGRFTKTKASREHSYINEVIVDKKNYFNLVERLNAKDVFTTNEAAEEFINSVCVE